jgi:hypothetical protein
LGTKKDKHESGRIEIEGDKVNGKNSLFLFG